MSLNKVKEREGFMSEIIDLNKKASEKLSIQRSIKKTLRHLESANLNLKAENILDNELKLLHYLMLKLKNKLTD